MLQHGSTSRHQLWGWCGWGGSGTEEKEEGLEWPWASPHQYWCTQYNLVVFNCAPTKSICIPHLAGQHLEEVMHVGLDGGKLAVLGYALPRTVGWVSGGSRMFWETPPRESQEELVRGCTVFGEDTPGYGCSGTRTVLGWGRGQHMWGWGDFEEHTGLGFSVRCSPQRFHNGARPVVAAALVPLDGTFSPLNFLRM